LGHPKEASSDLAQASEIARREDAGYKTLQVAIALAQAEMALRERQFQEAIANSSRAPRACRPAEYLGKRTWKVF
jgi:hypothetical protein